MTVRTIPVAGYRKKVCIAAFLLLLSFSVLFLTSCGSRKDLDRETIVLAIKPASNLVTATVDYQDNIEVTDSKKWFGNEKNLSIPFTTTSKIYLFKGTINVGYDFRDIEVDVNNVNHIITIDLPDEIIISHEVYDIEDIETKKSLFNEIDDVDALNNDIAGKKAEHEQAALADKEVLAQVQGTAEQILTEFIGKVEGADTYTIVVK